MQRPMPTARSRSPQRAAYRQLRPAWATAMAPASRRSQPAWAVAWKSSWEATSLGKSHSKLFWATAHSQSGALAPASVRREALTAWPCWAPMFAAPKRVPAEAGFRRHG